MHLVRCGQARAWLDNPSRVQHLSFARVVRCSVPRLLRPADGLSSGVNATFTIPASHSRLAHGTEAASGLDATLEGRLPGPLEFPLPFLVKTQQATYMQFSLKSSLLVLPFLLGLAQAQTNGTGSLFYFEPGLGACGFTNTSDQFVASVSSTVFNGYPGATSDPNNNPICLHNLTVTYNGTNVSAQIVDYYVSSPDNNVGFSPAAFEAFGQPLGDLSPVFWIID